MSTVHDHEGEHLVPRLPMNTESIEFHGWTIKYMKSHILKSVCVKETGCEKDAADCCELCTYQFCLELPHLPDMVFHKNQLILTHCDGAELKFCPMDALKLVDNGKECIKVACSNEWKQSRPGELLEEKFRPFDWTFTTNYKGTINDKFKILESEEKLNCEKLMKREEILFYHDLTLFEDELHDNGIASCSAKIRVMPSGYLVLLRFFLRVDQVLLKINDTRYHYEIENNYVLRQFTAREATVEELKNVPVSFYANPNKIENYLPIKIQTTEKLIFND